jgi:hypothetical protein
MRKELKAISGERVRFRAIVERFGKKTNYHGFPSPTILLKNVTFAETGKEATDHVWFSVGKTIEALDLDAGTIIEFEARVGDYQKGYVNHREYIDERTIDYKLNRPTRFVKISAGIST